MGKSGKGSAAAKPRRVHKRRDSAAQQHVELDEKWQEKWLQQNAPDIDSSSDDADAADGVRRRAPTAAAARESKAAWGKHKSAYYQVGDKEGSDLEEAEQELAEAMRLQRARAEDMADDDFAPAAAAAATATATASDRKKDGTDKKAKKKSKSKSSEREQKGASGSDSALLSAIDHELRGVNLDGEDGDDGDDAAERIQLEDIESRVASLPTAEQVDIVQREAPDYMQKLSELADALRELKEFVVPVREALASGQLKTEHGMSYLDAKYHLLSTYCTNLAFYVYLRANKAKVAGHPVVAQLTKLRVMLERLRPLDKRLRYQIEKLLRRAEAHTTAASAAGVGEGAAEDELSYKPRAGNLVSKLDDDEASAAGAEAGGDGVYRPPKMRFAAPDMADEEADGGPRKKLSKKQREKLMNSEYLHELREQFSERPEQHRDEFAMHDESEDERTRFEEENLTRLGRQKSSAKRSKRQPLGDSLTELDDFGDVLADEADKDDLVAKGVLKKRTLHQYLNAIGQASAGKQAQSADADLPSKSLQRAASAAKRRQVADDLTAADSELPSASEFGAALARGNADYEAAVAREEAKRKAKAERKAARIEQVKSQVFFDDSVGDGEKRSASYQMLKNKGLTPQRSKDKRNPRVHMRKQFEKAVKRRKGQVTPMRDRSTPYSGEATGIKTNVARSTRFQ